MHEKLILREREITDLKTQMNRNGYHHMNNGSNGNRQQPGQCERAQLIQCGPTPVFSHDVRTYNHVSINSHRRFDP